MKKLTSQIFAIVFASAFAVHPATWKTAAFYGNPLSGLVAQ